MLIIILAAGVAAAVLFPNLFPIHQGGVINWTHLSINFVVAAVYALGFIYQSKDISKKEKTIKDLKKQIDNYTPLLEKIIYLPKTTIDLQWKPVVERLLIHQKAHLYILNFTNTPKIPCYSLNLAKLFELIVKKYHTDAKNIDCVINNWTVGNNFIDWKNILDSVKSAGVQYSLKLFKNNLQSYSITDEKNSKIEEIAKSSENGYRWRDEYLLQETFWLIKENGLKVNRMYHLDWSLNDNEDYILLYQRFLFACSTVINCMFSPNYSLSILPARLNIPILDNYNIYSIVYGANDEATGNIWLSSGLNTEHHSKKKEDRNKAENNVEYLLLSTDGTSDKVIAAKCDIIEKHLINLWLLLKDDDLLLFENSILYSNRFDIIQQKISSLLSTKHLDDKKKEFDDEYGIFKREIAEFIEEFPGILTISNQPFTKGVAKLDLWFSDEINKFNAIFK